MTEPRTLAGRPARAPRPPFRRAARAGRALACAAAASLVVSAVPVAAAPDAAEAWRRVTTADGSAATPRHEAGGVVVDGRFYLMGGRGTRPLDVYDPATRRWRSVRPLPEAVREIHHFQPVAIGSRIYIVGALLCCYPREPTERTVHVYDTVTETWSTAGEMPAARARGSAAVVVRGGRLYVLGGNTLGHDGGSVPWFDVFDPASGEWRVLPDAPNARDHFTAALVDGRLVAAGGRTTDLPVPFDKPVLATDVYDFASGSWSTGTDIPTPRAGTVAVAVENELVVAGGEINGVAEALRDVEAYDVRRDRWRALRPLADGRHGGGAFVLDDTLHVVAGSRRRGGGPETSSHETLALGGAPAPLDGDGDGLDDAAERDTHMTDPARADTDGDDLDDGDEVDRGTDPLVADSDVDGLDDGDEVERGTDPLARDSDADGLDDGDEVTRRGTDPLAADSDADGLDDAREIELGTEPRVADSDADGLADGAEANLHGTDPLSADSDEDGLDDGEEIRLGTRPLAADSDDDGLSDGAEATLHGTDPLDGDSDDDGLGDGAEVDVHGTRPLAADSDDDGVPDGEEVRLGSDPLDGDSDDDGVPDAPAGPPGEGDGEPDGESDGEPVARSSGGGGAVWLTLVALAVSRLSRTARRTV